MDPKLIRIGDTIINPAFVTHSAWVVETSTPYRGSDAPAGTPAPVTTAARVLEVHVSGRPKPYRLRGPAAEAAWAALSRLTAPQD